MGEGMAAATRSVALTKNDLRDLRQKLDSDAFDPREKELVRYLTEQAESGMNDTADDDMIWTWTFRF